MTKFNTIIYIKNTKYRHVFARVEKYRQSLRKVF
jgi:hypothetical protein